MQRLFEGGTYLKIVPDKFTFSIYLFNSTLSVNFPMDYRNTKLIVYLELWEKFTQWKNPKRAKLSAVRANSFVVVEQFTTFSQFWCHCLCIGGAALIQGWRLLTFLSQMRRLFEGGAYSSKYGSYVISFPFCNVLVLKHT